MKRTALNDADLDGNGDDRHGTHLGRTLAFIMNSTLRRRRFRRPEWSACIGLSILFWSATIGLRAQEGPDAQPLEHLYILSFNAWGELQNPGERDLAIEELRDDPTIERIIIFAYGWANDGQASYSTYRDLVKEMVANSPGGAPRVNIAVIAVGWDSTQSGFRKLLNDIIPMPGVGSALAYLPDKVLFPISFWSKAAQADRIGFGGLRTALNDVLSIYGDAERHPDLYLVGHSFGTRIVASLMVDAQTDGGRGLVPFESAERIRGAVLLQPALISRNLNHDVDFPVLITMSRHDHAVGFLYPVANIPINAYGFTTFESIVHRRLLRPVATGVGRAGAAVTDVVPRIPPGVSPIRDLEPLLPPGQVQETTHRTIRRGLRTLGETLALPLNLVFTAVVTPIDYSYVQVRGIATRPISHVMDSLAQIPLVEIPVDGLSRLMGREIPWGQRSKGIFTLGPLHEGLGRMVSPRILNRSPVAVYSLEEIDRMDAPPNGIFVVDASEIVTRSSFGVDLSRPWADYTLGWLDPLGSHSDFRNPEVMELISWIANSPRPDRP